MDVPLDKKQELKKNSGNKKTYQEIDKIWRNRVFLSVMRSSAVA